MISPLAHLYDENGIIRYYNISIEEFHTYEEVVAEPTSRFFHIAYLEGTNYDAFLVTQKNSTNVAVKCNTNFVESHSKTSQNIKVTIRNLRYYTRYRISAAACTLVGCGTWKTTDSLIRTNEFYPTCSPANVSVHIETSTSLAVYWNHLKISCTHGILTQYRFRFGEAGYFTVSNPEEMAAWPFYNETIYQEKVHFFVTTATISSLTHSTSLVFRFQALKKFTNYCFQVSGSTAVGLGPYSNLTCGRTLQDCK